MKWGRGQRRVPPRPALRPAPLLSGQTETTIALLLDAPVDDQGFTRVHRDRLVALLHDLQRAVDGRH